MEVWYKFPRRTDFIDFATIAVNEHHSNLEKKEENEGHTEVFQKELFKIEWKHFLLLKQIAHSCMMKVCSYFTWEEKNKAEGKLWGTKMLI